MKKTYVIDTNVLLSDTQSIFAFDDNNLVIPLAVLEDLDHQKNRLDEVGQNAREVNRILDSFRQTGSLIDGVDLRNGGRLSVEQLDSTCMQRLPVELQLSKTDNQIIAFMLQKPCAILVSKDINVRIKCDSLGIRCQDYLSMRVANSTDAFYRGVAVLDVSAEAVDQVYESGRVSSADMGKLCPNQIVVLKHVVDGVTKKSALTKLVDNELHQLREITDAFGLKPRNKEQKFALDLLFDDRIKLVTLVGPAGTGKTLLALAAGLAQMKFLGAANGLLYQKMVISRPIQTVGNDIGFLPGTLQEKMDPWVSPIRDNLSFLMGSNGQNFKKKKRYAGDTIVSDEPYLAILQERGMIEIEALAYIRGRSIPNSYIVVDEAQNLSVHELKTIVTRVGDNTKIVLTGDIEQIDNTHVDIYTNGLSYAVERFKDHAIAGHVTLIKGERSQLATLASQIL